MVILEMTRITNQNHLKIILKYVYDKASQMTLYMEPFWNRIILAESQHKHKTKRKIVDKERILQYAE